MSHRNGKRRRRKQKTHGGQAVGLLTLLIAIAQLVVAVWRR